MSRRCADYCVCGGYLVVDAGSNEDWQEQEAALLAAWQAQHVGPGHGSTTADGANRARHRWANRRVRIQQGRASAVGRS